MSKKKLDPLDFSSRVPSTIGVLSVLALVFGVGTWSVAAKIDGAVLAPGRIIVDRNRQAVQHQNGGIVDEILIKEGDAVKKGDVLIRLDPQLTRSELAVTESRFYEILARRGRLEAERSSQKEIVFDQELLDAAFANPKWAKLIEGQVRLFEERTESLGQSIAQLRNQQVQLRNQIEGIDAQIDSLKRQLQLTKDETAIQLSLRERGLTQNSRVLNLQREDARLSGAMGEVIANRAQAEQRIAEIEIAILKFLSDRREQAISQLRDIEVSEVETRERRESLKTMLDRMEIRAPLSGIVYDLRVAGTQSVIRPADPLLFIIPQDRPLVIEAEIPPLNVSDVHLNQEVALRFQSVDMRQTQDLLGSVIRISPDAFVNPNSGASYYRAEVVLPETELKKLPGNFAMLPGMPVDTFFRTGVHSPIAYLAAPLTRYFGTAMR